MDIWIWLAIIVFSVVIEIATMELVSVWFAAGGLTSLVLNALNVGLTFEIIAFIVVSLGLLLTLRKWAIKFLQNTKNGETNLELFINKKVKLLTDITEDSMGTVSVNGVVWNATTVNDSNVKAGEFVKILSINGNKLIVEKGE